MKKLALTLTILCLSYFAKAQVSPLLSLNGVNSSANMESSIEEIHSKIINLSGENIKFKWTSLGYGALTFKVIIPELASHTQLNHRNFGEEGPCLRSDRRKILGIDFEGSTPVNTEKPDEIEISISAANRYTIFKEEQICKVTLVETVETIINNERFYHKLYQDIGQRHIDDCNVN